VTNWHGKHKESFYGIYEALPPFINCVMEMSEIYSVTVTFMKASRW